MAAMEDAESRFMHFLQPIRDLTKNWEVDVASQLGEYLEELEQICISFDGGKTTMNFIEAALLIQGSACIYSKKVEYLYSLVYQALDFISNKKRDKLPTSVGADGADADASAGPADEKEEFLPLDDNQETSRASMDLRDDQQRSSVNIVPLTPMALVPPEEAEKKGNPLFSQKGEMLASRRDFRMNTYTPHVNGTFMLQLADLSPTQCPPRRDRECQSMGVQSLVPATGATPLEGSICNTPILALDFSDDGGGDDAFCENDGGCDGVLPDLLERSLDAPPEDAEEHVARQMSAPQRQGYMLRERPPALEARERIKEVRDPWQSLDPFSSSEDKPSKKGRPFSLPRGTEDVPGTKRRRRLSSRLQEFTAWFSATEHDRAGNPRSRRKGPTFADLDVLYWKNVKERFAAQKKLQRRMTLARASEDPEAREEEREEEEEEEDALQNPIEGGIGADDDFLEDDDGAPLEDPGGVPETDLDGIPASLSYEELVQKNVELFIAHSQKYARETVLSRRVRDWEEMMGPQLEEQEARAAFDIHSYGDRLVSRLGRVGEWQSFARLVAGEPAFEVCRYMLASLQLANDYTVEVSQKPGLEERVDTTTLRLLTQEKAHERFRTYTAPSLAQQ
ncbi:condensin-2 complex subunit H2 [Anolis sagrei]|uniref:condensin-2 complex subunit H2 n=1 Tax=Anolis sagrei TaxID=38937 RepID=UPI00351FCC9E